MRTLGRSGAEVSDIPLAGLGRIRNADMQVVEGDRLDCGIGGRRRGRSEQDQRSSQQYPQFHLVFLSKKRLMAAVSSGVVPVGQIAVATRRASGGLRRTAGCALQARFPKPSTTRTLEPETPAWSDPRGLDSQHIGHVHVMQEMRTVPSIVLAPGQWARQVRVCPGVQPRFSAVRPAAHPPWLPARWPGRP